MKAVVIESNKSTISLQKHFPFAEKYIYLSIILVLKMVTISQGMAQLANTAWTMFYSDVHHTGLSPYIGPEAPILKWNYPGILWP